MPRFKQIPEILGLMNRKEAIRNVGIIAHIDHGKTTMTDSLLVEAGLLPSQVAGSARALDYLEEEQRRGITIKTANISLLHVMDGRSYVINLVDTPGHVDFTGKVTRALRAIDGAVVVVDAVEEVMAQTEIVTRQALEERVKPVLFINKLDRLVEEVKLTSAEIQKKLNRIIADFNNLIENYAEPEFKKWKVDPAEESVVFGSALHKWGFTSKTANEKGIKLSDSDLLATNGKIKHQTLSRLTPLHTAILDLMVKKLPSPVESQKYRIPKIWKGDTASEIGQAMLNCDNQGPTTMCITNAQTIQGTGLVATGRLFSGSIKQGDEIYLVEKDKTVAVQQVSMYMGAFREPVNNISAGNIAAISNLDLARSGNTLVDHKHREAMVPFEHVTYMAEPVMTISIEPRRPADLPKIKEAMNRLSVEDPNLTTRVDKETGQYLISGIGELHLEIATNFLRQYVNDVELTTSNPIAAYRETVTKRGRTIMAKSSNKRNKVWIQVQPLEDRFSEQKRLERVDLQPEESNHVWTVDENRNVLVDSSEGAQHLIESKASIITGFQWACRTGALCEEPLREVEVKLVKMEFDPDPSLREPAQITKVVSRAILGSFLTAKPVLLEPIYKIEVTVQPRWFGSCTKIISRRRGKILSTEQKGLVATIIGHIPVAETFGLSAEMRSATSGYAFWQFAFDHWSKIPENLANNLIMELREKRGLPKEIPTSETFTDEA
jgi:elongation factor 2